MKRSRFSQIRSLRSDEPIPEGEPRRYRSSHGYVKLRWKVGTEQYVEEYEHRIVAGRPPTWMHVHHINGDKADNDPENLRVMTPTDHQKLHAEAKGPGAYWPYRGRAAKEKAERRIAREQERAAEVKRMRELYESGLSLPQIAEAVGIDGSNVYRRLAKAGVKFRSASDYANTVDPKEVAEKYEAGRSQQSLAAEYRVTAARIRECLIEVGCALRRPGRPKAHPRMDENRARLLVRQRSGGVCEKCAAAPAREWHHRRNRSQGGPWSAPNGMDLCTSCHRYITEHPEESYENGWAVKGREDEARKPARMANGWFLLDNEGGKTAVEVER